MGFLAGKRIAYLTADLTDQVGPFGLQVSPGNGSTATHMQTNKVSAGRSLSYGDCDIDVPVLVLEAASCRCLTRLCTKSGDGRWPSRFLHVVWTAYFAIADESNESLFLVSCSTA